MSQFGWTIEYTLSLAFPVFLNLTLMLRQTRLDNALDTVYTPYCAGKYGGDIAKSLFNGKGSFFISDTGDSNAVADFDPKALRKAEKRMKAILAKRESAFL